MRSSYRIRSDVSGSKKSYENRLNAFLHSSFHVLGKEETGSLLVRKHAVHIVVQGIQISLQLFRHFGISQRKFDIGL